jgi:hypothetical protein
MTYGEVRVRTVLDEEAAAQGLGRAVQEFAAGIAPRDTVILFVAAHSISEGGRFYFIPQDYPGGTEADTLRGYAIGQGGACKTGSPTRSRRRRC